MTRLHAILAVGILALSPASHAAPVLVDFEGLADNTVLSNQVAGLTFTNATVLSAGVGLNEIDFPPFSGANVAYDSGGNLIIDFASLVYSVSARITYITRVTLTAYDAGLAAVATANTAFTINIATSGDVGSNPNELITVSSAGGISRIRFAGSAAGGSLVIDNLTYDTGATSVPEPATLGLLGLGLAGLGMARRRAARRALAT
jgi:hypothetical protein